jgi:hypothetical protein
LKGVSAACTITCDTCGRCFDPASGKTGLKLKFPKDGKEIIKDCNWVSNRSTKIHCGLMSDICRKSFGIC